MRKAVEAAIATATPNRVALVLTRYTTTIEDFIVLPEGYTSDDVDHAWHIESEESTFIEMNDGTCFKVPSDHTTALAMQEGYCETSDVRAFADDDIKYIAEHDPDRLIEAEMYDGD